jgi:MPBQ/MSBQ methyltransferase
LDVVLTGATGFVGSRVAERLLARGHRVRALVRPGPRPKSVRDLLSRLDVFDVDLSSPKSLKGALGGVDIVYHLAWQARSGVDAESANLIGTEELLHVAARASARFVCTTVAPLRPHSRLQHPAYAVQKRQVEALVRRVADEMGLEYVIVQPPLVLGRNAPLASALLRAAFRRRRTRDARRLLQPVHVDDLVAALLVAATQPAAADHTIVVAGSAVVTTAQFDALLRGASAGEPPERRVRLEDFGIRLYDNSAAAALLGWFPSRTLEESVAETVGPGQDGDLGSALASYYGSILQSEPLGDFYEGSDFWNFGYRVRGDETQREACEELMERLLRFIPRKDGTILDVGCGKGATTRHLLRYYAPDRVTGINISDDELAHCRRNAPGCTFSVMDAAHMSFEDETFDNILCVESACHFDTREDFLREAHRVLKPSGRLVMSDALLARWSRVQPLANYLESPAAYEEVCRRAGFAKVFVTDATRPCREGLRHALGRYADAKLASGEMSFRTFGGVTSWLRRACASVESYVLVCCRKA